LAWWRRASIAVLSSEREGMPVCLMEAAACGVPAVAPAVGGIPELIEDGVTGLLFPPGNAAVLAKCLMRLHADRSLRARLGAQARAVAERRFDLSKIADQTVSYLQEVAATVGARNRVAAA
jgi:glycosyltransferase involved in cell wall biosynthesis